MLLGTAAFRRRAAAPLRSVAYLDLAGINAASVAMSVGAYAPGRALFALAFQSNTLASLTIDGITPSLLASGNAGGMNVYLWATSASTASGDVTVVRAGSPANSQVIMFGAYGYADDAVNDFEVAGVSTNNQTASSISLDVPANGAVLAGGRQYEAFSAGPPTAYEVDNFSVGAAVANLAANPSYGITATVDVNRTLKVLAGASLIPV